MARNTPAAAAPPRHPSVELLQPQAAEIEDRLAGLRQQLAEAESRLTQAAGDAVKYAEVDDLIVQLKAQLIAETERLERLKKVMHDVLGNTLSEKLGRAKDESSAAYERCRAAQLKAREAMDEELARHRSAIDGIDAELRRSMADLHEARAAEEEITARMKGEGFLSCGVDAKAPERHANRARAYRANAQRMREATRAIAPCPGCQRPYPDLDKFVTENMNIPYWI